MDQNGPCVNPVPTRICHVIYYYGDKKYPSLVGIGFVYIINTMFETENECQKTEPVPIPLPRASRNFPDVKPRNNFFSIIGHQR